MGATMRALSTLPVTGWATIDSRGNIKEYDGEWDGEEIIEDDYPAIYCYECRKQLRTVSGVELEDIHTSRRGEDVCGACCDVCNRRQP